MALFDNDASECAHSNPKRQRGRMLHKRWSVIGILGTPALADASGYCGASALSRKVAMPARVTMARLMALAIAGRDDGQRSGQSKKVRGR